MIEHCDRCLTTAPPWESAEYEDWHLGADEEGFYLGVICPSCFASEGLAFVWAEPRPSTPHEGDAERLTVVVSSELRPAGRTSSTTQQLRTAA